MSLDHSPVIVDGKTCPLSRSLQNTVLQDPTLNSQEATELHWGSLALTNMVAILRDHGYEVIEPNELANDGEVAAQDGGEGEESIPSKGMKWADNGSSTPPTIVANGTLHRFRILTSLVEQNRGEDGRVDASTVEEGLLRQDPNVFDKEGVEQLKQYLMKARECGVPIKFDGDHDGLHQIWFKGHRDLETALNRYCHVVAVEETSAADGHFNGDYLKRIPSEFSNDWRQRGPRQAESVHPAVTDQLKSGQVPLVGYGFHNQIPRQNLSSSASTSWKLSSCNSTSTKNRPFDIDFLLNLLHSCGSQLTQGANALQVEEKLLEIVPLLYEIKPGVKRFNHYLMNMRAAGAPIWFNRTEEGDPKEIFLKNSTPPTIYQSTSSSSPKWRNGNTFDVKSPSHGANGTRDSNSNAKIRFESLIDAYRFHYQIKLDCADGHLVQARMESIDPSIYHREQCLNFKQLLKVARMNGLELNWEQRDNNVTRIRLLCKD